MRFATTVSTAPTTEPITLAQAKDYAKVETADDDKIISQLIGSARQYAENFTRKALMTQTITMVIDYCFPEEIELPINPVQSVTAASFTYVDSDGDTTQVSTSVYSVDTTSDPARIYLAYNQTWPTVRMQRNTISIGYQAGYASAALVPDPIKTAIKMLVVHMYENRQPHIVTIGGSIVNVPTTVDALLLPYVALI